MAGSNRFTVEFQICAHWDQAKALKCDANSLPANASPYISIIWVSTIAAVGHNIVDHFPCDINPLIPKQLVAKNHWQALSFNYIINMRLPLPNEAYLMMIRVTPWNQGMTNQYTSYNHDLECGCSHAEKNIRKLHLLLWRHCNREKLKNPDEYPPFKQNIA